MPVVHPVEYLHLSHTSEFVGVVFLRSQTLFTLPPSSPAVPPADAALALSRRLSSSALANAGLVRVRFQSLVSFFRVYSAGVNEGSSGEQNDVHPQTIETGPKTPIMPLPRPFKLNQEQRELAEEIFKVVDRYTAEDFEQNKRPKAFAVVQIGSHQFKVSPNDLVYSEKLMYCDINDKEWQIFSA